MTRNDELKAGQGMTTEEAQSLLNNVKHTQAEYDAVVRRENPGPMVSMTAEQYRWQRLMHLAETRLLQAAPALAQAYLGSEARLEVLTLERDRLAHELRLLREAVGVPAWTTIPLDLARAVLTVGRAQWGVTVAQDAEAHGAMMAQSVRLTAEHFQQGDEAQAMQVVFLEGTDVVIAYTGTSPYSGTTAQGMTAAWNRLHEDCAEAVAHASLSSDTPERSGGEGQ